jgi:hypothetical protein
MIWFFPFYRFFKLLTFYLYIFLKIYRAGRLKGKMLGKKISENGKKIMFQCIRAFQFEVREIQEYKFLARYGKALSIILKI